LIEIEDAYQNFLEYRTEVWLSMLSIRRISQKDNLHSQEEEITAGSNNNY